MSVKSSEYEAVGGPLDGDMSVAPAGADTFEWRGHVYRLQREDTGGYFWRYAGYVLVASERKKRA